MSKNGGKLYAISWIFLFLGIAASIFGGVNLINRYEEALGLIIIMAGSIISWIISTLFTAFSDFLNSIIKRKTL